MPVFDDKNSFGIDIESADITITMAALASDMNEFVFAVPGSPIKDLKIKTDNGKLGLSPAFSRKKATFLLKPPAQFRSLRKARSVCTRKK